jgi:anti-sigma-K factor RskA
MGTQEIIDSGDLELYVYGLLNEEDSKQIATLSKVDMPVYQEILSIEKSMLALSSSFSPVISSDIYEKIKSKLELTDRKLIQMKPKTNNYQYIGWAASIVLLFGIGYMYVNQTSIENKMTTIQLEKNLLNDAVVEAEIQSKIAKEALTVIRDPKNTVIALGGQAAAPKAFAKIYWNKETEVVYVDASGLPEPPEGKVYQIWSLKLLPQLTPTSIGLLDKFGDNTTKMFAVNSTGDAEAFGITLEPAGGSKSPTMEQLYTLGKV